MATRHSQFNLHESADYTQNETTHSYTLPLTNDNTYNTISALSSAIQCLQPIGNTTTDDEYGSAFIYAYRRFARIFKTAYEYDTQETKEWQMPTISNIYTDLRWHQENGIPPRTITIEKTHDTLHLTYEHGFTATDETLTITQNDQDSLKTAAIKNCGDGIKHEHAPYNPTITQNWRYNPSKIKFSIKSTPKGKVTLGIENTPPKQPTWYRLYKHISTMSTPYAYATFDMHNQSSVVKFVYNQAHETPQL